MYSSAIRKIFTTNNLVEKEEVISLAKKSGYNLFGFNGKIFNIRWDSHKDKYVADDTELTIDDFKVRFDD